MKCYYCGIYEATIKDYRDFNGVVGCYPSCKWCRNLTNIGIRLVQEFKLNPKTLLQTKNIPFLLAMAFQEQNIGYKYTDNHWRNQLKEWLKTPDGLTWIEEIRKEK